MKDEKNTGGIQMEYKKPELEIVLFHEKDVIATSGGGEWEPDKDLEELF